MIGHASIQLTYDTYGHLMPDAFDGFGTALDSIVAASAPAALGVTMGVTGGLRALDPGEEA